eukprot:scaffold51327_cov20-Prasinocladus_malaysianus.AAC.1
MTKKVTKIERHYQSLEQQSRIGEIRQSSSSHNCLVGRMTMRTRTMAAMKPAHDEEAYMYCREG